MSHGADHPRPALTCPEERIKHIVPLSTMLGGEIVHRRDVEG